VQQEVILMIRQIEGSEEESTVSEDLVVVVLLPELGGWRGERKEEVCSSMEADLSGARSGVNLFNVASSTKIWGLR
jgi:hypothetical protein